MRLAPNWRTILRRAWTIRLILLAGALTGVEAVLPFVAPDALPEGLLPTLTLFIVAAAFVARLVAQKGVTEPEGDDDA